MKEQDLITFQKKHKCVLLGISSISKLIIDSTIEYANNKKMPIMLIASRRQVDSLKLSGGYVEGWDSKTLVRYIRKKDKGKFIFICRDHGGPWQNDAERNYRLEKAMVSAKESFAEDIKAGFDIIHIDSSIDPSKIINFSKIGKRLLILYEYCYNQSIRNNKNIKFEIGTEEQSDRLNLKETKKLLEKIIDFCKNKNYPAPFFIVVQIGTLVKELENFGEIKKKGYPIARLIKAVRLCERYGLRMKVHNGDYLDNSHLSKIKEAGVHSINIGPEFGTSHTKWIIEILDNNNLNEEKKYFVKLAVDSDKWKKWLVHDNRRISNFKKTVISGHYVFSSPEFKLLYREIRRKLKKKGIDVDKEIKNRIRYLIHAKCKILGYFD